MHPNIVIRSEMDADVDAITEVTIAAFETLEISNKTEQFIIEALRAARALAVSLVADVGGRVGSHQRSRDGKLADIRLIGSRIPSCESHVQYFDRAISIGQ